MDQDKAKVSYKSIILSYASGIGLVWTGYCIFGYVQGEMFGWAGVFGGLFLGFLLICIPSTIQAYFRPLRK
jgi:hypothetical protein